MTGRTRLRRALTTAWVAVAAWLGGALLADPAWADHCGTFTDCFNQSNAAAEAGFGLILLTGLSLLVDLLPVVGDARGISEGWTGRDALTGQRLSGWERALGFMSVIPIFDVVRVGGRGLRYADDLAGLAGRTADDAAGVLRAGDAGPTRLPGEQVRATTRRLHHDATDIPHPPLRQRRIDDLIAEYNTAGTSSARRGRISEQLGELGATSVLERLSGRRVPLLRGADHDLSDFADLVADGQPWPGAATFRGRNVTNVVWFDGDTLHIIEAKGGDGIYGSRNSDLFGKRIDQTHPEYPLDVAADMQDSKIADGRNTIGDIIEGAYRDKRVQYFSVRTGTRRAILDGQPATWIEHVFQQ